MAPKVKQDIDPNDMYAAIEGAAHNKAKEIAVAVLGPLANPTSPEAYAPPFGIIAAVRKRCIYMSEDGDLDDDLIEEATVELRFAIGWAQGIAGQPLTAAEAIEAFDALDTEPDTDEKLDELLEKVDAL